MAYIHKFYYVYNYSTYTNNKLYTNKCYIYTIRENVQIPLELIFLLFCTFVLRDTLCDSTQLRSVRDILMARKSKRYTKLFLKKKVHGRE